MKKKYDVVVIGSGIGGLVVASLLSSAKKVLLLEKGEPFGGYCSDFTRNGFRFESSVQAINGLYAGNPVYEILLRSGALENVNIVSPKILYRAIFPDYDIKVPQQGLAQYEKMLCSMFPEERDGISMLFNTMKSIFCEMSRFHREKTLKKSPFILKYSKKSLAEMLAEFINSEKLKAIIAQYWIFRGLPPSKFAAITFAFIWYDYTVNGSFFPENGMGSLIHNLVKRIKNNDGIAVNRSEVSQIVVKKNKAVSVVLKSGDKYDADVLISNADAVKTLEMITTDDKMQISTFLGKIKNNVISTSACKVYLGLSKDVRDLGITEYEIFVNPNYDIEEMYIASLKNQFNSAAYAITVYSNIAGSFCRKGNSIISIGMLAGYDYWAGLTSARYAVEKKRMAEIMIDRCEKVIPGMKKHITTIITATPLTMERYTNNSRGAIYGWNPKSLMDEMSHINPTTPVNNLYLASHWTKMGGGIGGALLAADRTYDLVVNGEPK